MRAVTVAGKALMPARRATGDARRSIADRVRRRVRRRTDADAARRCASSWIGVNDRGASVCVAMLAVLVCVGEGAHERMQ